MRYALPGYRRHPVGKRRASGRCRWPHGNRCCRHRLGRGRRALRDHGTLIAWATELRKDDVVALLERNLREEKAADKKLSTIAEARVNKGSRRKLAKRRKSGVGARRVTVRKVSKAPVKARKRPAAQRRRASSLTWPIEGKRQALTWRLPSILVRQHVG